MDTKVVKIQRGEDSCDIYIGNTCNEDGWDFHRSKWANPFPSSKYGKESSLERYRTYISVRIKADPITYDLEELRGKTLGCWCKPEACHGDILIELLNGSV